MKRGGLGILVCKAFDYSSVEGYTDKVLHVIVSSKDEVLDIRVDWVQCE